MLNLSSRRFARSFSSITVPVFTPDYHLLDNPLPETTTTTGEELLKYYKDMAVIRRMEIDADLLYKGKEIRGFCHLYDGQEAITIGMEAALNYDDAIIGAYRVHGTAIGRGDTVHGVLAEMMQKRTGSSKGKGGSMHYYNSKNGFYGGNGIVGAQIPVGAGVAFALKYKKMPNICVAMYGDGAANQGQVFEAANMAGLWKLPCIFLCENNNYAMGTSTERAAHNQEYYKKGQSIPGIRANGMNVFTVREVMKFAKQYSGVEQNGPLFIEFNTYRYHGHSMSDPGLTYRTRDEVNEVRKTKDPILQVKNIILENGVATEKDLKDIDKQVRADIAKDIERARNDPEPQPEELYSDIYDTDGVYHRGVEYPLSWKIDH